MGYYTARYGIKNILFHERNVLFYSDFPFLSENIQISKQYMTHLLKLHVFTADSWSGFGISASPLLFPYSLSHQDFLMLAEETTFSWQYTWLGRNAIRSTRSGKTTLRSRDSRPLPWFLCFGSFSFSFFLFVLWK